MKRTLTIIASAAALILTSACTRIETGEVGLRLNASKQIEGDELLEGSFNQTLVGDVLTFPVRDIAMQITDQTPLTAEDTKLADLDFNVIFNITPSAVSTLWSKKSKSFHLRDKDSGDWYLMYNYMWSVASNAAVKSVRKQQALKITDNREVVENDIRDTIQAELKKEGLETSINVTSVRVTSILPNPAIVKAATDVVEANQRVAVATAQVQVARQEAERMQVLASNAGQSIAYMQAQSQMEIAKAVREGKVNTIILPMDFKGMVNVTGK
jgi:regulator of protease activity HflC (stomatin/prohibitin superfamily)